MWWHIRPLAWLVCNPLLLLAWASPASVLSEGVVAVKTHHHLPRLPPVQFGLLPNAGDEAELVRQVRTLLRTQWAA